MVIAFVIIRFSVIDEIYLMVAKDLFIYWKRMKDGGRKSITLEEVKQTSQRFLLAFNRELTILK